MDIQTYESLSPYARFWFRFLTYDFQCIATGKLLTKGEFYEKHRLLAFKLSMYNPKTKPIAPKNFALIKRTGLKQIDNTTFCL
jgi:hypothetical protein